VDGIHACGEGPPARRKWHSNRVATAWRVATADRPARRRPARGSVSGRFGRGCAHGRTRVDGCRRVGGGGRGGVCGARGCQHDGWPWRQPVTVGGWRACGGAAAGCSRLPRGIGGSERVAAAAGRRTHY